MKKPYNHYYGLPGQRALLQILRLTRLKSPIAITTAYPIKNPYCNYYGLPDQRALLQLLRLTLLNSPFAIPTAYRVGEPFCSSRSSRRRRRRSTIPTAYRVEEPFCSPADPLPLQDRFGVQG